MIGFIFQQLCNAAGMIIYYTQATVAAVVSPCLTQADLLRRQMSKAESYDEWRRLAIDLDRVTGTVSVAAPEATRLFFFLGGDRWRQIPKSKDYDYKLIAARLEHLRTLEQEQDVASQMFFVRTGNIRGLGGIGKAELYRHSPIGTKMIVEEYVHEVVQQLYQIYKCPPPEVTRALKKDFFAELLQTFGRTVLLLHGGASFGLCHLGVVKALYERSTMPQIFCGSYIGALVASLICVQEKSRLAEILSGEGINFEAFYRNGSKGSFRRRLTRFLKYGRLFDIRVLEECARSNIGDITFKEAYERSGLILNITVYAKRKHEVPVLLNYLTAPDLVIWTAACASLATPGIYEEVILLCKRDDGTIQPWHPSAVKLEPARIIQEAPVKRLTELFNANNFIVSQVPSYLTWKPVRADPHHGSFLSTIASLLIGEVYHRFRQLKELGLIPNTLLNLLNLIQAPIVGDIQITPSIYCSDIRYLIANPSPDFVRYCIHKGEVATWRRLPQIQMRCAIESALLEILNLLDNTS